jgi:NRAMP (natural resistance-associated macrophage protein)-like metal ion transporter
MPSSTAAALQTARPETKKRRIWQILGPGLITGASDDDPSGIATYAQVGAQFGYGMTWLMLFSYPLMAAIQEISGRIGRVTGQGIAGNIRTHYSPALLQVIVGLLFIANVINIGADLGAMGDAVHLLVGGSSELYAVLFAVACAGLEIFARYDRYVAVLKWTAISLLAYVAAVLVVHVPWSAVAHHTFIPSIPWQKAYLVPIVAVLGTTISPYLFFWQSSEEAEEERIDPEAKPLVEEPSQAPEEFRRIEIDTYIGMLISNIIGFFIIVTTAATLHVNGVTDVKTSADAAQALRPIAGQFASTIFALGIIGTGLLAIPVLAGSAAYAVGEALKWPTGLSRLPLEAKAFYGTIALAVVLGSIVPFAHVDPMKALFWSAVINGIVAVPVMAIMMLMSNSARIMGQFVLPPALRLFGWLATAVMSAAVVAMFVTSFV